MLNFIRRHAAWFTVQVACAAIFLYFYDCLVITDFKPFALKQRDLKPGVSEFRLPDDGDYVLKIWLSGSPRDVAINGKKIQHSFLRKRKKINEFYYLMPNGVTREGANTLALDAPSHYSISIKNNFASSTMGIIFLKMKQDAPAAHTVPRFLFFLAGFILLSLLTKKIFVEVFSLFDAKAIFWAHLISFVPIALFFEIIIVISKYAPAYLKLLNSGFFGLFFINYICAQAAILLILYFWKNSAADIPEKDLKNAKQGRFQRLFDSIKRSSRRPFFAINLFLFLLFLVISASLFQLPYIAEVLANLGFIVLIWAAIKKYRELA